MRLGTAAVIAEKRLSAKPALNTDAQRSDWDLADSLRARDGGAEPKFARVREKCKRPVLRRVLEAFLRAGVRDDLVEIERELLGRDARAEEHGALSRVGGDFDDSNSVAVSCRDTRLVGGRNAALRKVRLYRGVG